MKKVILVVVLAAVLLCSGCPSRPPVVTDLPAVPVSEQVGGSVAKVTEARQEVQAAGVAIKVEAKAADPAKAAPALAKIDVQADKVIAGAGRIQAQEASLVVTGQQAAQLEDNVKALVVANALLLKKIDQMVADAKARDESWARKIALAAIVIASLAAGIGMWINNLRLSLAAGVAGAVAVGLSILAGAIYAWRNWILLGVVVAGVVVGVCLFLEWRKKGSLANVLRETDKVATAPVVVGQ